MYKILNIFHSPSISAERSSAIKPMKVLKPIQNPIDILIAAHWLTTILIPFIDRLSFGKLSSIDFLVMTYFFVSSLVITGLYKKNHSKLYYIWNISIYLEFLCILGLNLVHRGLQSDEFILYAW